MSDDLLERIAVVKAKWSMDELVEALIGDPVPYDRKIPSPFNEADETPSCHIYDDHFYDYSTGRYGDVVDMVKMLKRCTVERAVQILEEEADELGLKPVERVKVEKPPFVVPELGWWTGLLSVLIDGPNDFYNYSTGKNGPLEGVSNDILGLLAFSGRIARTHARALAIIHTDPTHAKIIGIKYRHGDGKKTSEPGSDFSSFLYQPLAYATYRPCCVITEGETDSWAWLSQRPNDHVYSLPSGAQSWKDKFLQQLQGYEKIYLAFDNDDAGKRATDKVTSAIGWGRAEHVQIPKFYGDIREAVAAGWVPPKLEAQ